MDDSVSQESGPEQETRKRGGCLTLYLGYTFFTGIAGVGSILRSGAIDLTHVFSILLVAGVVGLWKWKRWAIYTLAGAYVLMVVDAVRVGSLVYGLIAVANIGMMLLALSPTIDLQE